MPGICAAVKATTSQSGRSLKQTLKLWKSRPAAPRINTLCAVMTIFASRVHAENGEALLRERLDHPVGVGPVQAQVTDRAFTPCLPVGAQPQHLASLLRHGRGGRGEIVAFSLQQQIDSAGAFFRRAPGLEKSLGGNA